METRGASPRAAAISFGIGQHHLRQLIREGAVKEKARRQRASIFLPECTPLAEDSGCADNRECHNPSGEKLSESA